MDSVNRQRMEHMTGGPLGSDVEGTFNRIQGHAFAVNGESHPTGWILSMAHELAYLSSRVAELEKIDDPIPESDVSGPQNLDRVKVKIKDEVLGAVFLGFTPKSWFRVRLDGESRVRVVPPSKVFVDG